VPCRAGSDVSPVNTAPARERGAALLSAGEERLSALLSPARQRVYSSRINLGSGEEEEGRVTGRLIFPSEG